MSFLRRKPKTPIRDPAEHDWTRRQYQMVVIDGGQRLALVAWSGDGPMPHGGDYLILRNKDRTTRYRVDGVEAAAGLGDVHTVKLTFAPRKS